MVQLIRKLKASTISLLAQDGEWSDKRRSLAPSPEEETELVALETPASPSKAELAAVSRSRSANRGGTNRSNDK